LYAFFVSATGWYDVWRHSGGKWTALVNYTRSSVIKTAVDQTNIITVRTNGTHAWFYINGTEVNSITNTQQRGSLGGLVVETSVNERYNVTYQFGDYGARY
jgi:cytochrome c-type biogenesis protein CcmE